MSEENQPPANEGGETFTPITSQEQLTKLIGQRINAVKSQYADYDDLKAKAAKLDEVEAASQTEAEKAVARAEAAEKQLEEYRAKEQRAAWVAEAVKDSGVPADLVRGSTKEEVEAHAASLKAALEGVKPKSRPTPVPPGKAAPNTGSRAVDALRQLRAEA